MSDTALPLRERAARGALHTGASMAVVAALQLAQLAALGRLLSPSDFGLMALVAVVIGFAQAFPDLGVGNALIHRQEVSDDQVTSVYWVNLAAGGAVFLAVAALAVPFARLYGEPRLLGLLLTTAAVFLVAPLGQVPQVLLQKQLRFDLLFRVEVLAVGLSTLAAVLAAWRGLGVYALVLGQLTQASLRSLAALRLCRTLWRPRLHFRRADLAGLLGFGFWQMAERTVNYLASNLDKLLVGKLLGTAALGLYHVASQISSRPLQLVNPVVTRVAFPVFAVMQEDDPRLRRWYAKALDLVSLVNFPVYLGMCVLAEPLLATLAGPAWREAAPALRPLALLGLLFTIGNPLGSLLLAKGRPQLGFAMNLLGVLVYAAATTLGARHGIAGVASSILIACLGVMVPLDLYLRRRLVGMSVGEGLRAVAPNLALAAAMAGAVLGLSSLLGPSDGVLPLALRVLAGAAVYAAGLALFRRGLLLELLGLVRGARG